MSERYGAFEAGLPPIPENYWDVYDYYSLSFDMEGIPGRLEDGVWREHPMYPTYLMRDFMFTYVKCGERKYLEASKLVLERAITRMVEENGALIYKYDESKVSTLFDGVYYSALTQSNYLRQVINLFKLTEDIELKQIAHKLFRSLTIPTEQGGVLYERNGLVHIEEYPRSPVLWTLNGWITTIQNIKAYIDAFEDRYAQEMLNKNVKSIEHLLELYDCPEQQNSRYQLTGFFYIKIRNIGEEVCINKITYQLGSDSFEIGKEIKGGRWNYYAVKDFEEPLGRKSELLINVVGSCVSDKNDLLLDIQSKLGSNKIEIYVAQGDYNPLLTAMPTQRWELIATINNNTVRSVEKVSIPKQLLFNIAYPTNFKKKIANKFHNAYHFIHIEQLEGILSWYDSPEIKKMVEKWKVYCQSWKSMPIYADERIVLEKYGTNQK